MLTIHTTDVHGFSVTVEKFASFVDALLAFDFAKNDMNVGRVEMFDLSNVDSGAIKNHTTLWATFL